MSTTKQERERGAERAQLALATAMLRVLTTGRLPTDAERADLMIHVRGVTSRADPRW